MSGYVHDNGESNTYSTIAGYSNVIKEIVNSSGLFKNRYEQVVTQLKLINDMAEQFNSAILPSLKHDLVDIMDASTNWEQLQKKLSVDIKTKPRNIEYNLKPFKLDTEMLEAMSDDLLVNMNMVMSDIDISNEDAKVNMKRNKKHINQFNEYKNLFVHDLDRFVSNIKKCEDMAIGCRNKNVEIMKYNINELYKIHSVYAYNVLHKNKNNFTSIDYITHNGDKVCLQMCKSQKQFIRQSIKQMLGID